MNKHIKLYKQVRMVKQAWAKIVKEEAEKVYAGSEYCTAEESRLMFNMTAIKPGASAQEQNKEVRRLLKDDIKTDRIWRRQDRKRIKAGKAYFKTRTAGQILADIQILMDKATDATGGKFHPDTIVIPKWMKEELETKCQAAH